MSAESNKPVSFFQPNKTISLAEKLQLQIAILKAIRQFFQERAITEVITPCMTKAASSEPFISSFAVADYWLRSSPEHEMKRLLMALETDIYQIGPAFRKDEHGNHHRHEFTLVEWYRRGWDYHRLMVECLVLLSAFVTASDIGRRSISYRELFLKYFNLDPFACTNQTLYDASARHGYQSTCQHRGEALDFLFELAAKNYQDQEYPHCLLAIYDFPLEQASFARIAGGHHAERFEIFFEGIELANGYSELTEANEYRARMAADNEVRAANKLPAVVADEDFLQALEDGKLTDCAGVSVGLERLLMCMAQSDDIDQVCLF